MTSRAERLLPALIAVLPLTGVFAAATVVGPGDAGAAGCSSAAPIYVLPPAGG